MYYPTLIVPLSYSNITLLGIRSTPPPALDPRASATIEDVQSGRRKCSALRRTRLSLLELYISDVVMLNMRGVPSRSSSLLYTVMSSFHVGRSSLISSLISNVAILGIHAVS